MKKTKIIATIGPASSNSKTLKELVKSGLNVARINFSHGTPKKNQEIIDLIKDVRTKTNSPLSIMVDTRGPEVRVKTFEDGFINLKKGQDFSLWAENKIGILPFFIRISSSNK